LAKWNDNDMSFPDVIINLKGKEGRTLIKHYVTNSDLTQHEHGTNLVRRSYEANPDLLISVL